MGPLISVIIPTHNRERLLRRSLESVAKQAHLVSEVLVVDDANDTETVNTVLRETGFEGIGRSLQQELLPGGASKSRNLGASVAAGDWLAFLDDDDEWEADYLNAVLASLENPEFDCIVSWFDVYQDGVRVGPGRRISTPIQLRDCYVTNPGFIGSNIVVRRDMHRKAGGFDESLSVSNDKDYLISLLVAGARIGVVTQPLVRYQLHSSGQLTNSSPRRVAGLKKYESKHAANITFGGLAVLRYRRYTAAYRSSPSTSRKIALFCMRVSALAGVYVSNSQRLMTRGETSQRRGVMGAAT